jgi:hypothetical protein
MIKDFIRQIYLIPQDILSLYHKRKMRKRMMHYCLKLKTEHTCFSRQAEA